VVPGLAYQLGILVAAPTNTIEYALRDRLGYQWALGAFEIATILALATIVVLSFIVERALALLFEWRFFVNAPWSSGVKEPIAFLVSLAVCWYWRLDALSVILRGEKVGPFGTLLTAAVIAGGSKAALKLFRDVLGVEADNAKKVRLAGAKRDADSAKARTGYFLRPQRTGPHAALR